MFPELFVDLLSPGSSQVIQVSEFHLWRDLVSQTSGFSQDSDDVAVQA